jgi:hypothetical protein
MHAESAGGADAEGKLVRRAAQAHQRRIGDGIGQALVFHEHMACHCRPEYAIRPPAA